MQQETFVKDDVEQKCQLRFLKVYVTVAAIELIGSSFFDHSEGNLKWRE